jgi:hypothetical protein
MLRKLLFVLMLLNVLSLGLVHASEDNFNLRFWDGTFAYNELNVNSLEHNPTLVKITLQGSQINLGQKIEGTPETWSWRDRLELFVKRDDCQIDLEGKAVLCEIEKTSVSNLTWMVNLKITKSYNGLIQNVRISGSKASVSVSFDVPSDEDFSPANERVNVQFFTIFF